MDSARVAQTGTAAIPEEQFAARRDAQIGRILGGTIIEGGERSEVLVVGFQSGDPKEAAAVANAVAEAYIEFGLQSRPATCKRQVAGSPSA